MTTADGPGDVLLSTFEPQGHGAGAGPNPPLRPWEGVIMEGG